MKHEQIPIAPGLVHNGSLYVICPYCAGVHRHGPMAGYRIAHCCSRTYYVREFDEQELKQLGLTRAELWEEIKKRMRWQKMQRTRMVMKLCR
ncbi:MAG: hypothetical protein J7L44_00130 [Candidatus Diapherotrites archaeon]|nr:hypothetical protein [Candidatus Diapherotrites archaeon]